MRCEKCNVELYGDVDICPLCHNKILLTEEEKKQIKPLYYPPKSTKKKIHKHLTPKAIYLFVACIIFIACVTTNYLTSTTFLWCYLVGASLLYGFVILAHTVLSHSGVGVKIFIQGASIALLCWIFEIIIKRPNLTFDYSLPIVLTVVILVIAGFLIFTAKRNRSLIISSIMLCLLGYLPIILFAFGVTNVLLPSLITAILASINLVGTIAFGIFDIKEQFSKVFHI